MSTQTVLINAENAEKCLQAFVDENGTITIPSSIITGQNKGKFIEHLIVICHLFVPNMQKHLANWLQQGRWNLADQDECCCGDLSWHGQLAYGLGFKEIGDSIRHNSHCRRGPATMDRQDGFDPLTSYLSKTHKYERQVLEKNMVLGPNEIAITSGKTTEGAEPGEWSIIKSVYSTAELKPLISEGCLMHIWASNALLPLVGKGK